MVLVSQAVEIEGAEDEHGAMTTIEAGAIPLLVNAPGHRVTIRGLRFVRPFMSAVFVFAVRDFTIDSCRVEGLTTSFGGISEAIGIMTTNGPPNPTTDPGKPENVSGSLLITNNDIDAATVNGGTTLGVVIFGVGVVGAEVEVHVSGNTIRNASEVTINLRAIVGQAYIEENVLTMSSVSESQVVRVAIKVVNFGPYLIARNTIECTSAQCVGISVFSPYVEWPIIGSIVEDNDVTMSPPPGTVFVQESAGIVVFRIARENIVRRNTIRGSARAGISIPTTGIPGVPTDNAFMHNIFAGFTGSLADIYVGDGALRTLIVGPGTVVDRGTGTIINP